ncbi:deleted in malignant brain tumors 1 protein-like [Amblyraja radiata]|uniref:deleted in malignant brain tumors 1 protein-like n=1 Tax=Amblyraja radiata TaxID=386614 RepID=UPI0014022DAD|nr:deleted in malignant brain tumors 1 protein-like [Amblyraja radiata]
MTGPRNKRLEELNHTEPRLVSKDDQCSGRLEVQYGETWGTVCDRAWDMDDANVVCSQLQCGVAVSVPRGAYFGKGTGLVRNDVFECKESVKLRLANGGSPCTGRVEVINKGNWGTVYDGGWDLQDAAVVCRELGCGAATGAPGGAHFGPGSGPVVTYNVECSGSEAALRECRSPSWGNYAALHSRDAGVICEDHREPRLVSKDDQCSGRLEVQYGETWGTVCDLAWDMDDANVVCSQLHCGEAVSVPRGAYFGKGTGLVRNDVFECKGNETSLWECPRSLGTLHCNHTSDVSVICSGECQLWKLIINKDSLYLEDRDEISPFTFIKGL